MFVFLFICFSTSVILPPVEFHSTILSRYATFQVFTAEKLSAVIFSFPLSSSFHLNAAHFIYRLVLPEGQTSKHGALPKKQCFFGNVRELDRESFQGVNTTDILNYCTIRR
jgi:hypothetical protein